MQAGGGDLRQPVGIGVRQEDLAGRGGDAGISVDLAVLHGHQLGLVLLHVIEDGAVQLYLAAPIGFVADDLYGALRLEGLDDEGAGGYRGGVDIGGGVQIQDRQLGTCQLVQEGGADVRRGDGQSLLIHGGHGVLRQIGEAAVDLGGALQVAQRHFRCEGAAIGEMHAVLQGDRPGEAIVTVFALLRQQGLDGTVVAYAEERFGEAVVGGVPAVILPVGVQAGVGEADGKVEDLLSAAGGGCGAAAGGQAQQQQRCQEEGDKALLFHGVCPLISWPRP